MRIEKTMEFRLAIYDGYGSFRILPEIAKYLKTHKNWKIAKIEGYTLPKETPPNTIYHIHYSGEPSQDYWHPNLNTTEFRSNPDLIEAITQTKKHLEQQQKQNRIEWKDYYYNPLRAFKVIDIAVMLEIESYNDGHERVVINNTEVEYYNTDEDNED
jgi:hypothetical protein